MEVPLKQEARQGIKEYPLQQLKGAQERRNCERHSHSLSSLAMPGINHQWSRCSFVPKQTPSAHSFAHILEHMKYFEKPSSANLKITVNPGYVLLLRKI